MFVGFNLMQQGADVIRIAFTLIGGKNWTGGYNYLLNLVRALSNHAADRVQSVVFFGMDMSEEDALPFQAFTGVQVVFDQVFNEAMKGARLRQAILLGVDQAAANVFFNNAIDVVFEPAQYYGWRFPVPAVAWIPDFQHRYLKHLFDFKTYWKRELGFRAQIGSGRHIMLSSNDAQQDCERFYPSTRTRTHVVRFAVPATRGMDFQTARIIADAYGLPTHFFFLPNQFWKHKNHECVIRALGLLKKQGRDLVIAATGKQMDPRDADYFPSLMHLIDSSGLRENFRLLGLIPHEHIAALMRSCAALINPSTFEGWSTTVEEAKAMGTPMILSSLRVHQEQSQNAYFFDMTSPQQLANILSKFQPLDESVRMQMNIEAARQAEFDTKIFADEFAKLMTLSVRKK